MLSQIFVNFDSAVACLFFVFQLEQRTFHRPVHLFYNNVRYDPDKETASFLVLEQDWKALHSDTVLILISSSVSCTSHSVELKSSCKATKTDNVCCFTNEDDMKGRNTREKGNMARPSKRRKSRLARNISCVSVSCISDVSGRGLQKYDSCYRLDVLTSQDLVIHNSGHAHSSTDCLVSAGKNTTHLFQKGIDSPSFQLDDEVTSDTKVAVEQDGNVTVSTEQVDNVVQSFGLLDVMLVIPQSLKSDHLEVVI